MVKIAIIGAGGYVFPMLLIRDILSFPALRSARLALYDIDLERVKRTQQGTEALIAAHGLAATSEATDDRRTALAGADFVICAFHPGGNDAYTADITIPRRYGIDQTVGDTLGPGGVFRGLRSLAAFTDIASDMREQCPDALLIQYANPMSINCWGLERLGIKTVGLCHSVQHTSRMLAEEIGVPYADVVYDSAGLNHTAWFTTFRRGGADLLPTIREVMIQRHLEGDTDGQASEELHGGGREAVRTELMRLTGYFHTESSHHASEYWSWFRKDPALVARYLPERWDYFEICTTRVLDDRIDKIVDDTRRDGLRPSDEFGAYIIDSMVTGTPRVIYGNVPNEGAINNLPPDACVEVACHVDGRGLRAIHYGDLPAACAALNLAQVNVQRLAVQAGLTGDRELVHAAVALDPLTSTLLTLPQTREMVDEMLEAQTPWLPQFPPVLAGSLR